jgi:hypothetical protein
MKPSFRSTANTSTPSSYLSHQIAIPSTYELAGGHRTRALEEFVCEHFVFFLGGSAEYCSMILEVVCAVEQREESFRISASHSLRWWVMRLNLLCVVCAVLFGALSAVAQNDTKAPTGQNVVLTASARGVQIYGCVAAQVFRAPSATLFDAGGSEIGTHAAVQGNCGREE